MITTQAVSGPAADTDLRQMMLIRHFEWKLLELFERGELNGTTHTCLGQEYVPVALTPLLDSRDFVFSNHRGHGHYLARFDDPRGLLAEIMGRDGGVCHGVGGSQHILRDRYLSTGVQGQSLPVATGVALALKRLEPGALACVYIGDGTWGEGAVYEALNMAALWQLPLLVVVEHNGIAQSTPTEAQMSGTIAGRAEAFGLRHHRVESMDVDEIRRQLAPVVSRVRETCSPVVIEVETNRVGPHSKGDDSRPPAIVERARERDWYRRYAAEFPDRWAHWDNAMKSFVDSVAVEVAALPPAVWSDR
ncbi:thiamine pyrophosphate-dependent dehydrogenase E1 component subunit alpha [Streptomyces sp. NBC_00046]|uniref:thiamine pyrophosphate-dependent dehydrogenase E1 component subunit alpha n=1 Tax=unclassified Streptomyces TaxID=2593676 RepID=UPI00324DD8C4